MAFIEIIDEEERVSKKFEDSLIILRRIDAETADRIEKKYRTRAQATEMDEAEKRKELIDYIILSWENVIHPVSKLPVPCTRENKMKLPQRILAEVLAEAMRPYTLETSAEEQLKNFGST